MPKPKGNAFAAALKKPVEAPATAPTAVAEPPKPAKTPKPAKPANTPAKKPTASTRTNTKFIGGHFDPVVSRQFKEIGLERGDLTMQEMVAEAYDLFFQAYGKPTIASRPKQQSNS